LVGLTRPQSTVTDADRALFGVGQPEPVMSAADRALMLTLPDMDSDSLDSNTVVSEYDYGEYNEDLYTDCAYMYEDRYEDY
jgi:hypothetical protein